MFCPIVFSHAGGTYTSLAPECLVTARASWEMQNIVRKKGAFQILLYTLDKQCHDVSTEILLITGITRPTATHYYIGIFVIKCGGRSLVRR